jgi:hypothetical protein
MKCLWLLTPNLIVSGTSPLTQFEELNHKSIWPILVERTVLIDSLYVGNWRDRD